MSRRLTPTTPLGDGQLARYSAAPVATVLYLINAAPGAIGTYWLATARGDLLSPEGKQRQVRRFEGERSGGVLLSAPVRAQLAMHEYLHGLPSEPGALRVQDLSLTARRYALRAYQRRLQQLADVGLLHRCTRSGVSTLHLVPHTSGDPCDWAECPIGMFGRASRGDAVSVTPRRSERHEMTLETGQHVAEPENPVSPAETAVARTSRGDADNRLLRRMNEGCESAEEQEAMERLKTILGAVEMHTTPTPEIETTLTDLVVAQFMASLQEESDRRAA